MMNLKDEKCLIAYYSRNGNNYVGRRIVNLPIGNTEVFAKPEQILKSKANNLRKKLDLKFPN